MLSSMMPFSSAMPPAAASAEMRCLFSMLFFSYVYGYALLPRRFRALDKPLLRYVTLYCLR